MNAMISFLTSDNKESRAYLTYNFTFIKEAYTPYTQVTATFSVADSEVIFNPIHSAADFSEVTFYIDSKPVHRGLIDSFRIIENDGGRIGILKSRGFSSLLLDNQIQPGIYTDISINELMDNYYSFYKVTHEKSSDKSYIYVKSGSSMWDAVVNLSYKLYGTYPHIKGMNEITMTPGTPNKNLVFDGDSLLNCGSEINTTHIISDFHMADVDDTYGKFNYTNPDAVNMHIVRNRYFDLDRRFLYNPEQALHFRDAIAAKSCKRKFCTYSGYSQEDLFDTVSFGDVTNGLIKSIKVTGDQSGMRTELSVYYDKFT